MHAPLVGLMGYAQAGKDTFGAALGWRRFAFADALKTVAYDINPWVIDQWNDVWDLQTLVDQEGWDVAKVKYPDVRPFLQKLGMAVRTHIDPSVWVQAAFLNYNPAEPTVFTDVRYENEVDAIRSRGGYLVKIVRGGHTAANDHVSETLCDVIQPDFLVTAPDGDVAMLENKARMFNSSFFLNEVWS